MGISTEIEECATSHFFSEYSHPLQQVPDEQEGYVNPRGLASTVLLRGEQHLWVEKI